MKPEEVVKMYQALGEGKRVEVRCAVKTLGEIGREARCVTSRSWGTASLAPDGDLLIDGSSYRNSVVAEWRVAKAEPMVFIVEARQRLIYDKPSGENVYRAEVWAALPPNCIGKRFRLTCEELDEDGTWEPGHVVNITGTTETHSERMRLDHGHDAETPSITVANGHVAIDGIEYTDEEAFVLRQSLNAAIEQVAGGRIGVRR